MHLPDRKPVIMHRHWHTHGIKGDEIPRITRNPLPEASKVMSTMMSRFTGLSPQYHTHQDNYYKIYSCIKINLMYPRCKMTREERGILPLRWRIIERLSFINRCSFIYLILNFPSVQDWSKYTAVRIAHHHYVDIMRIILFVFRWF